MQRLHHLLELADAHAPVRGVGGVGALRHVVVLRVVAPVVLGPLRPGFVHRLVVGGRQQVHVRHAQLDQVVDARRHAARPPRPPLREGQVAALVLQARAGMDGEVADVQLVDDRVGRRAQARPPVARPPRGVRLAQVHDHAAPAVDPRREGIRVDHLVHLAAPPDDVGVVPVAPVARDAGGPGAPPALRHEHLAQRRSAGPARIQADSKGFRRRRPDSEGGGPGRPSRTQVVAAVYRVGLHGRPGIAASGPAGQAHGRAQVGMVGHCLSRRAPAG